MKLTEQFKNRLQKLAGVDPGKKAIPKKGFSGGGEIPVYLCAGPGEAIEVTIGPNIATDPQQEEYMNSFLETGASFIGFCDPELTNYTNPLQTGAIVCSVLYDNNLFTGYIQDGYQVYAMNSSTSLEDFENQFCPGTDESVAECADYPAACCLQQLYGQDVFGTTVPYGEEEVNVPSAEECEGMTLVNSSISTPYPWDDTIFVNYQHTLNPNNSFEQGCCYWLV